tara:strand:- start:69 stop:266 length:198 start_codon:yes stop_codon:yes gene_type:complete
MTLGYILVMVTILANGDIYGEALDYYVDQNDCIETAIYEAENSQPGISYVCVADYVQDHIFKEKI